MKRVFLFVSGLLMLASLATVLRPGPAPALGAPPDPRTAPQEAQKPNYDYMSGVRSRSTRPLGLKEDPYLKRMLGQGAVRWAIRAGTRQVLD